MRRSVEVKSANVVLEGPKVAAHNFWNRKDWGLSGFVPQTLLPVTPTLAKAE